VQPLGHPGWKLEGFPRLIQITYSKTSTKKDLQEIEYRTTPTKPPSVGFVIKFRLPKSADAQKWISRFVLIGPPSSPAAMDYRQTAMRNFADSIFTEELSALSMDARLRLLELANGTAKGIGIRREVYKGNPYLSVALEDGPRYNTIQLNEPKRVAREVSERLLGVMKAFGASLPDIPEIRGVAVHTKTTHDNFVNHSEAGIDDIHIYAPAETIAKFAANDITSQQFIDSCVVIVNDNRVQVSLQ
jgi:hypothetical protein